MAFAWGFFGTIESDLERPEFCTRTVDRKSIQFGQACTKVLQKNQFFFSHLKFGNETVIHISKRLLQDTLYLYNTLVSATPSQSAHFCIWAIIRHLGPVQCSPVVEVTCLQDAYMISDELSYYSEKITSFGRRGGALIVRNQYLILILLNFIGQTMKA